MKYLEHPCISLSATPARHPPSTVEFKSLCAAPSTFDGGIKIPRELRTKYHGEFNLHIHRVHFRRGAPKAPNRDYCLTLRRKWCELSASSP